METNKHITVIPFLLYLGVAAGLFLMLYVMFYISIPASIMVSVLPLGLLSLMFLLKNPQITLLVLFIANYFVMGATRYIHGIMGGITIDILIVLILLGLFFQLFRENIHWDRLKNGLTIAVSIWFLFCILNIVNPLTPAAAWIIGIRRTAVYFFFVPVFTFLFFNKYKHMKMIIYVWSVFVILAVLKALIQKFAGFDAGEMYFLYVEGKAKTHIIYSGIRYFSFFTDAANFGCGMAFSLVFFSIAAFHTKNKIIRFYLLFVSLLAGYGMIISGTRAAIVIPFTSYALYAVLSRSSKVILAGVIVLMGAFIFLNYTTVGQGNSYIRRIRTTFNPEQDASFLVRMRNQQIMRSYMADKPFGVGIGTAKAAEYSNAEISKIPTDSWLVMVWVETGIVGVLLYLGLILFIVIKGGHIVMFEIKNQELKILEGAFLAAIFGIFVASYANEVVAQFPNGPIIYMAMAFIFMAKQFDTQIVEKNLNFPRNGKTA